MAGGPSGHDFTDTFVVGSDPSHLRRPRRRVVGGLAALVVVAGAAGAAVVVTGGKSAEAAVIDSVNSSMSDRTAHVSMNLAVTTPSATVTGSGTGGIDFSQSAMQLQLTAGVAGQQIQLQALYIAGTVYEQIPDLDQSIPGKSWISLDLSSPASAGSQGSSTFGAGDNPTAMLHLLAQQGNTVVALGSSAIDGTPVQGYAVTLDPAVIRSELAQAKLPSWVSGALAQVNIGQTSMKVYVDGSGLLRRIGIDIAESIASSENVSVDESLDFSDYGAAVNVSPPPSDQVASFEQFLQEAQAAAGSNASS